MRIEVRLLMGCTGQVWKVARRDHPASRHPAARGARRLRTPPRRDGLGNAKPIIVRPDPDSVLSAAKWVLGIYAHCPPFYSELPAHPFCFNLRRALLQVFLMSRKIADQWNTPHKYFDYFPAFRPSSGAYPSDIPLAARSGLGAPLGRHRSSHPSRCAAALPELYQCRRIGAIVIQLHCRSSNKQIAKLAFFS